MTSREYIFSNEFFPVLLNFSILSNLSKMSIRYSLNIKLSNWKKNLKKEVRHTQNRALCQAHGFGIKRIWFQVLVPSFVVL